MGLDFFESPAGTNEKWDSISGSIVPSGTKTWKSPSNLGYFRMSLRDHFTILSLTPMPAMDKTAIPPHAFEKRAHVELCVLRISYFKSAFHSLLFAKSAKIKTEPILSFACFAFSR